MIKMSILSVIVLLSVLSCNKPSDGNDGVVEPEVTTPETPAPVTPSWNPDTDGDGTIRILAIGNSFSADAVEQELYPLFAAAGKKVVIGDLYVAGCPLEKHAGYADSDEAAYSYRKIVDGKLTKTASTKMSTGLSDEKWDLISLQEGGGHHGETAYMEPYLTSLIAHLRKNVPSARLIYHVPWAAQKGYDGVKFSYYDYDQMKMYSMICDATKWVLEQHKDDFALCINTFDAIQNGRTSFLGDTFNRDGYHLNMTYGRYTAGCIWYERITGESVVGNKYFPSTISENVALLCQTAAHEAVEHMYQITDLSYFEPDAVTEARDTLAAWVFTPEAATGAGGYMKTFTGLDNDINNLGVFRYTNVPGEIGYIDANLKGSGRLYFTQVDKTAWSDESGSERAGIGLFKASNGGQPYLCGLMAGDCITMESDLALDAGTEIYAQWTLHPMSYGAKYWMLEYQDGTQWKPAPGYNLQNISLDASGENFSCNLSMTASTALPLSFSATLAEDTDALRVRLRCMSEYQVNDKYFAHPRTQSEQRIAGTPDKYLLPLLVKIL
mgnify:CR=1 FL=1